MSEIDDERYKVFSNHCEHCAHPEDCIEMCNKVARLIENAEEHLLMETTQKEAVTHLLQIATGISH